MHYALHKKFWLKGKFGMQRTNYFQVHTNFTDSHYESFLSIWYRIQIIHWYITYKRAEHIFLHILWTFIKLKIRINTFPSPSTHTQTETLILWNWLHNENTLNMITMQIKWNTEGMYYRQENTNHTNVNMIIKFLYPIFILFVTET